MIRTPCNGQHKRHYFKPFLDLVTIILIFILKTQKLFVVSHNMIMYKCCRYFLHTSFRNEFNKGAHMSFTLIRARISHHCFTRADGRIDNELINAPLDWLATTLNKTSLLYPSNITNHSIMDMQILDTIAQNHPALRITIRCRRYINWRGSFYRSRVIRQTPKPKAKRSFAFR